MGKPNYISTGLPALDEMIQGFELGDNVVWQIDRLEDYRYFAEPFIQRALKDGRRCLYLRFASHEPILPDQPGLQVHALDPQSGFDSFSRQVHQIVEQEGLEAFYVFDNLSSLVSPWATDELLANFFQVTCPYLYELRTVAYFALNRLQHEPQTIARIRDTTQVLLTLHHAADRLHLHPLKVREQHITESLRSHPDGASRVWMSTRRHETPPSAREPVVNISPWHSVPKKLKAYRDRDNETLVQEPEAWMLKRDFAEMLLGGQAEMRRLAERYMTVTDLFDIRERMIGSGRIGGKAAGMLMARAIVNARGSPELRASMEVHDSFYIGSDLFFTYLVDNNLFRMRLAMTRDTSTAQDLFEEAESRFLAGSFSDDIIARFREMLAHYDGAPIIVRSSSLLEDGFGNAFAGKYRSEFCVNQGSPDDQLAALITAVQRVYASTLSPDALQYRKNRGLHESDEQMAVLIQRVSGRRAGSYYFPMLAGVAFSRNLYAWTDRIDPEQGMMRLVFGLGTRAVNRVERDYPRMIAVNAPELRPEIGNEIMRYSQHEVDVLDLNHNQLATRPIADVLRRAGGLPLHLLVSERHDGHLSDPYSRRINAPLKSLVLTFNNLIRRTPFVMRMGDLLASLDEAYGHPVDTEFTAAVNSEGDVAINLLQCRTLWFPGTTGRVTMPENLASKDTLFRSSRFINGGIVQDIDYVIYIEPRHYTEIKDANLRNTLSHAIRRINRRMKEKDARVILMGPGRWGSSNIDLGIPVGYADIDHVSVLVELAREEAGHVPEVSYGTHFFQDLVESGIFYMPVYPDAPESEFNEAFFAEAPNTLADFLPDSAAYKPIIKVIHLPDAARGRTARLAADPGSRRAVCHLA